ncbi:MAG: hypothetical protein RIR70_1568 [Pseudomonadota bacterium]|jgi:cupin fold WbuC family metalloprotein
MNPFIDQALLARVSDLAKASPRLRKNHNFHLTDEATSHRLLNAIEPGSYVMPHRHLDAAKDETMIVLRGRLGVVLFDDEGVITHTAILAPSGEQVGVNIPHGTWHSVLALESGTVFFEAKAGPYLPLSEPEIAPWAPRENEPLEADYAARLARAFGVV